MVGLVRPVIVHLTHTVTLTDNMNSGITQSKYRIPEFNHVHMWSVEEKLTHVI